MPTEVGIHVLPAVIGKAVDAAPRLRPRSNLVVASIFAPLGITAPGIVRTRRQAPTAAMRDFFMRRRALIRNRLRSAVCTYPQRGTDLQPYLGTLPVIRPPEALLPRIGPDQMPMLRRSSIMLVGIGSVLLAGCTHNYVAGPGKSPLELGRDTGRCHMMAHMTRPDTSFEAYGSSKEVAIVSGAALAVGAIATLAHDSEAFDDCMQANGWLVADGPAAAPNAVQPVAATMDSPTQQAVVTATPLPAPQPAVPDERAEQALQAQRAAEAWLAAQNILNSSGPDKQKRELNTALCNAGDRSACIIALAMLPGKH